MGVQTIPAPVTRDACSHPVGVIAFPFTMLSGFVMLMFSQRGRYNHRIGHRKAHGGIRCHFFALG